MGNRGRNINKIDDSATATVEINSVSATTILAANPKRISATISLDFQNGAGEEAFIREFAALVSPNLKAGELLSRITTSNANIIRLVYKTEADNPYLGEISGITNIGSFNVHAIERII